MTTKTNIKAGGSNLNHDETLRGVPMKTQVKAGGGVGDTKIATNHNESLRNGLATRTSVKAGRRVN